MEHIRMDPCSQMFTCLNGCIRFFYWGSGGRKRDEWGEPLVFGAARTRLRHLGTEPLGGRGAGQGLTPVQVWRGNSTTENPKAKKDKQSQSAPRTPLPSLLQNSQISTNILLILKENKLHKWDRCFLFVMTVSILFSPPSPALPSVFLALLEAPSCAIHTRAPDRHCPKPRRTQGE